MAADLPPGFFKSSEVISVRMVFDRSIVEFYINGGVVTLTTRVYPMFNESRYISTVFWHDAPGLFLFGTN